MLHVISSREVAHLAKTSFTKVYFKLVPTLGNKAKTPAG